MTTDVDWERLLELALTNRVAVPLATCMGEKSDVPDGVRRRLAMHELRLRQVVEAQKEEFERILPLVLEDNDVILLKGIAYVYTIYRERPLRPIGDIDLLVDRTTCWSLFGHLGDHWVVPRKVRERCNLISLEYHHNLNINSWWYSKLGAMKMEELWGRSVRLAVSGLTVGILSPEDNFIYLAFHNVIKGFCKLYRFVDMLQNLGYAPIDWDAVIDRSHRYRITRAVWANCMMLNALRPGAVPVRVLRQLQPSELTRRVVGRLFSPEATLQHPRPSSLLVRALLVRPGTIHKVLFGDLFRYFMKLQSNVYAFCLKLPVVGNVSKSITTKLKGLLIVDKEANP